MDRRIETTDKAIYMLVYPGHNGDDDVPLLPHTEGAAIRLARPAHRALIGWESRGPRITTATFRTKK